MPNGGSDCCGTCWFNARNGGKAGYGHAPDPGPTACLIRDCPIANPFYTYCANHPYRCPDRDPVPIGPIMHVAEPEGPREFLRPSPDSEAIRLHLLELLERIEETENPEYMIGPALEHVVVWQLGEFRETRARDRLERIARFEQPASPDSPASWRRENLLVAARDALRKMESAGG